MSCGNHSYMGVSADVLVTTAYGTFAMCRACAWFTMDRGFAQTAREIPTTGLARRCACENVDHFATAPPRPPADTP